MIEQLWLVPFFPFLAFLVLLIFGRRCKRAVVSWIGVSGVALSALLALSICSSFFSDLESTAYRQTIWTWIPLKLFGFSYFSVDFAFWLDSLSLLMMCIITSIGAMIALFSVAFMDDDPNTARFFAMMNLFISAMLILVLADNFMLMYLGWEGVGVCSYLLIGFWYQDPANGRAAAKAFLTTRVGDIALLIGILLTFASLGTLNIQEAVQMAHEQWVIGSGIATAVTLCLLGGAVGKSAQLPLQTWLPDAMRGPTPVSALIHAATMVTAGVYLIARSNGLFSLAPIAPWAVMTIGAATLLIAGLSALCQRDIKRVLAYSTISQIGYMFLALGAGAYSAAMFHLLTHACFKALLFLTAGVIGHTLVHSYDMDKMGGLKRESPFTFWVFLTGACSLAAIPLISSGFYSKEFILSQVFASQWGGMAAWSVAVLGACITSAYTFHMVFVVFFGEAKTHAHAQPGWQMTVPLSLLAIASIVVGFIQTPAIIGDVSVFSHFMEQSIPILSAKPLTHGLEWMLMGIAVAASLLGIWIGYLLYKKSIHLSFAANGFGFDALYDFAFIRPYNAIAQWLKPDGFLVFTRWLGSGTYELSDIMGRAQSGRLAVYSTVLVLGAVVIVGLVVLR